MYSRPAAIKKKSAVESNNRRCGYSPERSDKVIIHADSQDRRSVHSSEADAWLKLERTFLGSIRPVRNGVDDLLSSIDSGKHDYDWLLTPPGTPVVSSSNVRNREPSVEASRLSSQSASVLGPKLTSAYSENAHTTKRRSTSTTRLASSKSQSTYSITNSSSALNTNTTSVTFCRPSTPTSHRSWTPSTGLARCTTPARSRPSITSSLEKSRQFSNLRHSVPSSSPQVQASLNSLTNSRSRSSTPQRRNAVATSSSVTARSSSAGRASVAPAQASSPGPRARPLPIVPPDFPLDAPPNLRITMPDRPVSAGRSRPGAPTSLQSASELAGRANMPRRQSSPIVGKLLQKSQPNGYWNESTGVTRLPGLRASRPALSVESARLGRNSSKNSVYVTHKQIDSRHGTSKLGGLNSVLYPGSVQISNMTVRRLGGLSASPYSVGSNSSEIDSLVLRSLDGETNNQHIAARSETLESLHYDSVFLKEDSSNYNWLVSMEDTAESNLFIDQPHYLLTEPFGHV